MGSLHDSQGAASGVNLTSAATIELERRKIDECARFPVDMRHAVSLADDYVSLEPPASATTQRSGLHLLTPTSDGATVVEATVLAVGPGEWNQLGTRNPVVCRAGDRVLVMAGAGTRFTYQGRDWWIVYGGRKDIVGVLWTPTHVTVAASPADASCAAWEMTGELASIRELAPLTATTEGDG